MARREQLPDGSTGDWQHLSYAQALQGARSIGQALLDRGLSAERPVMILSENSLEHALLALGCIYAGIPYCPASPAYSTVSQDYEKLRHVFDTLTPGLVFAGDAARFGRAIAAVVPPDVEVVLHRGELPGRAVTAFDRLLATPATAAVDAAMAATGPDTIAKFLFTSGSTKLPKAVVNTQRMWCANQLQIAQSMPTLAEEPPVLVDWLPWNHTFGSNHNVGITLYNGGTLYIDDGKPTPALMGETLRNLREIAPTVYFNVPTGFEAIAHAMQADAQLRRTLLSRVRMFFYSGAGLAQPVWDSLHAIQEAEIGERIVMAHRAGHDGVRAVRHVHHQPGRARRRRRRADAGHDAQADRGRRQDRGALSRPQHHARLLARARRNARGLRRGRLLLHRRRGEMDRRERHPPRPALRRPHRGRLQARHRHLRQRGPDARPRSSPPARPTCRTWCSPAST